MEHPLQPYFFTSAMLALVTEVQGAKVLKLFSCSTQLSMKLVLLISLKLLTIANSFLLHIAEHETGPAYKSQITYNCKFFLATHS